jgi:hypothetical protein
MLSVLGKSIVIFKWFSGSLDLNLTNDLGGLFYTIDIWIQFCDEVILWFIIKNLIGPAFRSINTDTTGLSNGI